MENKNTFGPAFKKLREKRGYSISEACRNGNIMTPAALRKFENTSSSTSIENFNRLLIAIGATWEDFWEVHEGNIFNNLFEASTKLSNLMMTGDYSLALKLAKEYSLSCSDNQIFDDLLPALTTAHQILRKRTNPLQQYNQKFKELESHLQKVETWGDLELKIFSSTFHLHNDEFIIFSAKNILKRLKSEEISTDDRVRAFLNLLLYIIGHLSRNSHFNETNLLIKEIENFLDDSNYMLFIYEKLSVKIIKSANLLRQNNPEGIILAKEVIELYSIFESNLGIKEFVLHRNDFCNLIHSLNKTGIPFDPY